MLIWIQVSILYLEHENRILILVYCLYSCNKSNGGIVYIDALHHCPYRGT